jgi:hypothetical protein
VVVAMQEEKSCTIVTITDKNFVLAVFILVLSLKYHGVRARIKILGLNLSDSDLELLSQFDDVEVVASHLPASTDRISLRALANISKRDAILAAKSDNSDYIALLDGDCIVTGDITPYLTPDTPGLYLRIRSAAENTKAFKTRYESGDTMGGIPRRMLEKWQKDVNENQTSNLEYTVLSGNFIVHRDYLGFIEHWGDFMEEVLPFHKTTFDHVAYEMMGDFTLSAMLAFAHDVPPLYDMQLDKDPQAYVAHLGPKPKFWEFWQKKKLGYFHKILLILDWAEENKIILPAIPWTLQRKNTLKIYLYAYVFEIWSSLKNLIRPVYHVLSPEFKNRRRKY